MVQIEYCVILVSCGLRLYESQNGEVQFVLDENVKR